MLRSTLFLAKGMREFTRGGYEKAAKSFDAAVLERDLRGKVALVTGANQGLGLQTRWARARRRRRWRVRGRVTSPPPRPYTRTHARTQFGAGTARRDAVHGVPQRGAGAGCGGHGAATSGQ